MELDELTDHLGGGNIDHLLDADQLADGGAVIGDYDGLGAGNGDDDAVIVSLVPK